MKRGPFQGVRQILMYNAPMYGWTLVTVAVLLCIPLPLAKMGAVLAAWWWLASLLVSWYVYDVSDLYQWNWIQRLMPPPRTWVNIHAGLDETTAALRQLFPSDQATVLDIYCASMTEPSIERARRLTPSIEPAISCRPEALPLADESVEAAFVIFAAHEIRTQEGRIRFFEEIRRVLENGGHALLVEHLRDAWNVAAFGPGAWHFWPQQVWQESIAAAGLSMVSSTSITPFVRVLVLRR